MHALFEYDVAFSFHSRDESLAVELNDLLQDRFKTFLYSEQQKVLAGRDGEEVFNAVFSQAARIVVVLCRAEWGQTPFTRIEQTAIRNRAFHEGYDFTLFVPTTEPAEIPKWLPRPQLYFGLQRFGTKGAAAVIESKIQQAGGEAHDETAEARAARFKRAAALKEAKKRFRESDKGVKAASEAFAELVNELSQKLDLTGLPGGLRNIPYDRDLWVLMAAGVVTTLRWRCHYANSLEGSELCVEVFDSMPNLPGTIPGIREARRVKTLSYDFELLREDTHCFVERGGQKRHFENGAALAEHLLKVCMDIGEQLPSRRR